MKIKETFNQILDICFEEDFPELNKELVSIQTETEITEDYISAINEIYEIIYLYAEDFPQSSYKKIENIIEEL